MIEIICRIKEKKTIENIEYFILEESENFSEHILPINQLWENNLFINSEYKFYKDYIPKLNKYLIFQEHPYYKIDNDYDFEIKRIEIRTSHKNEEISIFIVEDIQKNEISVKPFYWQLKPEWNRKALKCKVCGYRIGGLSLENVDYSHPYYALNNIYEFEIIGFSTFLDKNNNVIPSVIVRDLDLNEIPVGAREWQNQDNWKYKTLFCEVVKFKHNGIPLLFNRDQRHPYFEVGKDYSFKISKYKTKLDLKTQKTYKLFDIIGEDGFTYETSALPGQIGILKEGDLLTCKVVSIGYNIRLSQTNIQDPYFVDIQNIIKEKELREKYFLPFIESESIDCHELKEQYSSKSAFYVFTLCNKILPQYLKEHLKRYDYKTSRELNQVLIKIEEWIIKGGIISSFPDKNLRELTHKKASIKLQDSYILNNALQALSNVSIGDYLKTVDYKNSENAFQELFYILAYSEIKIIDESIFINCVIKSLQKANLLYSDIHYLEHLDKVISYKKYIFYDNRFEKQFNLIARINSIFENKENQERYFNWTYCQFIINDTIKNSNRASYLAAKLLRYYYFVVDNYAFKSRLIFNSYFILNTNYNKSIYAPFVFDSKLIINVEGLPDNPNISSQQDTKTWSFIRNSFVQNSKIDVKVTKKHYDGFEIVYQGITGFLPVHHITDPALKFYNFPVIDFLISISVILYAEEFNFFIGKQLSPDEAGFLSTNNLASNAFEGKVIEGVVKSIIDYGIFVTTPIGDGLLHRKHISHHMWDADSLNKTFSINEKIFVYVNRIGDCNRIELSLKELINTEYSRYYENFLNKVEFGDFYDLDFDDQILEESDESKIQQSQTTQIEKAFCFEQFALLQYDLDKKIQFLRLAKQFYATINNARSYLINLYTDYFQILKIINSTSSDLFIDRIKEIKIEANKVKNRIDLKTVENFPDSEKLLYFLQIISMFNETSDESFQVLYNLLMKYTNDPEKGPLKTIAKLTFANNLMFSESNSDNEFSFKNLKLLKTYLDKGFFSLQDDESAQLERENREKLNYWRGRIQEEESEILEFKSTFRTPILDEKSQQQLLILKGKVDKSEKKDSLLKEIDKINGNLGSKAVIHSSFKTLAAFANTNGGTLLLGVRNDKSIIGLEVDYENLREKNRDGFGQFFDSKIKEYFEESFSSLLEREFLKFPEGDILIIKVKSCTDPIFLLKDKEGKEAEQLFIRELTTTKEITEKKEIVKFIQLKVREQLKTKLT